MKTVTDQPETVDPEKDSTRDTFRARFDEYEREERVMIYLAGGLGGLGLFGAGDLAHGIFGDVPSFWRALFISLALICAVCIGRAYIGFHWAKTEVAQYVYDHELAWDTRFPASGSRTKKLKTPNLAHWFLRAATIAMTAAGFVLAAAAWLGV